MVSRQFQKTQLAELICGAGSGQDMLGFMKVNFHIAGSSFIPRGDELTLTPRICDN